MSKNLTQTEQHIYDLAPVGVCLISADATPVIQYSNAAFDKLFGCDAPPVGQALSHIWPTAEAQNVFQDLSDGGFLSRDLTLVDDTSWINVTASPTTHDGQAAFILWVTDITSSQQQVEEAENMMQMKSNFLATMSHEIRTPMQSVFGLLELIDQEDTNQNIKDMVRNARTSASGMLELLDDILDLAKVDAGKMELDVFEVPVRTLAYGILECLEVKISKKHVELKTDIDENVPFVVVGDPTRLRQIILNLLGNAMKFTEQGSITLRITQNVQHITPPENGIGLRFEIEDTGIGMPPHVCEKLFQAFTQADSSTTRKFGGTGLGLSISQKLVDLMAGQIGVESVEGEGSTFWFEIPTEAANTEDDSNTLDMPSLDGLVVLSVEDHPQGAKEIKRTLTRMGADVTSVPTFADGLDIAKKRRFDVAVIDQGLPDGLGIDLMKEIEKLHPMMGLIMYTVRDDIGLQHSAKTLGATYLTKPASRVGLGEAVKAAAKQQAPSINVDGPIRLLIAEDTESVQDILRRQLTSLGVEADFVDNGAQALQALEKGEHGIVFTDLHMPEVDGYELVSRIRKREEEENLPEHERFPVVVLTADVQMAQKQAYLSYGFNECLLKPVTLGQLKQLLVRWGILETSLDAVSIASTASTASTASPSSSSAVEESDAPPAPLPPSEGGAAKPPAIDHDAMVEQMGGFNESIIEMMHMFVDMTAPQIVEIRTLFDNGQTRELGEAGHSLKGAARSACCMILGDAAHQVQESCDNGQLPDEAIIEEIEHEFERVKAEVQDLKA